ncbi:MAG: GNAT family N-acetyltransferase [Lachnospiraceae bacterium]|nr:GNAT family N-acetyltransferase [Lachnospiraceae bacterium]
MIWLRPWKKEDFKELMEWFSDEETFYKWSAGKFEWPLTESQLLDYYGQFEKDKSGWILAALDDEGRLAGHLLMRKADYGKRSIHFGFIVVSPRLRGKGAGRAMVSQALKYAGEILGMERVTLGVFENNPAARRCYEAAGFQAEGITPDVFRYQGKSWAVVDMAADLRKKSVS